MGAKKGLATFIDLVLHERQVADVVCFGIHSKTNRYFDSILNTVERTIVLNAKCPYKAIITIDGLDRKKAAEYTSLLRSRGIHLVLVRGRRDESEPAIRLADMWAGCIRAAHRGDSQARKRYLRGLSHGHLIDVLGL